MSDEFWSGGKECLHLQPDESGIARINMKLLGPILKAAGYIEQSMDEWGELSPKD